MSTVLSDKDKSIFELVNFVSLCSVVCMFGIVTNIINILIFSKQGFKNTVNIGFFGLAVSDLICLIALQWGSISLNPVLALLGVHWFPLEVMYLSGAWPHMCFSRITSFITVYVTAERYISIALPLKVKHIITRKTTTLVICTIYCMNIACLIPEYATAYLGWRFDISLNETRIGLLFTAERHHVEGVIYVVHAILGMLSFAGVLIFTALLVIKLEHSSRWRKNATCSSIKTEAVSNRDAKTVKMVVLIACVLIACYSPGAVVATVTFIIGPEFDIRGKYINICEAMWSIAITFQSINSSVNIFLYYAMSSKYRQTFHEVVMCCKRNRQISRLEPARIACTGNY